MQQKGEVGGHALNSHGNHIVDHGKNHGIVFLNFYGNPVSKIRHPNLCVHHFIVFFLCSESKYIIIWRHNS